MRLIVRKDKSTALSKFRIGILLLWLLAAILALTGFTGSTKTRAEAEAEAFSEFYAKVTAALKSGNPAEINKFIHPEWGLYIVDRPGAIDKMDTARNIQGLYAKVYKSKEQLQTIGCKPKMAPMPAVNCEAEESPSGCVAEHVSSYKKMSGQAAALKKHGFKENVSIGSDERLKKFEKLVRWETVNLDQTIALAFIEVNGKWYLGVVDFAKYSCEA